MAKKRMTEAKWLNCTDPKTMLDYLEDTASARKCRLFAVACCRRIWQYLKDKRSRRLVEVAESLADGAATVKQLRAAFNQAAKAQEAIHYEGGDAVDQSAAEAVLGLREELLIAQVFEGIEEAVGEARAGEAWDRIYRTPGKDYRTQEAEHNEECDAGAEAEKAVQAALLRCIFGNPFQFASIDPAWLRWHDGLLLSMAQQMYDSRDFTDMSVLADALEEAGCQDQDILGHCRSGVEHVRGCWLVDLLLGKE